VIRGSVANLQDLTIIGKNIMMTIRKTLGMRPLDIFHVNIVEADFLQNRANGTTSKYVKREIKCRII